MKWLWLVVPYVIGLLCAKFIWFPASGPGTYPYHWELRMLISLGVAAIASFVVGFLLQSRHWSLAVGLSLLAGELTPPGIVLVWILLFGLQIS